ncbi:MAG: TetR/AcrR family transcriptional regulator C-terminal domain-containing protein [Lachnospiraceae bacterium]|nr:TetR/AcrR family transcriptional regulator C-terminal domain-containing protein [Lachnospiraceae bacterium]
MVQYTKRAIEDTFLRMVTEQSLDRITVKDLVTECGVNRNTFYYHYTDIYDLIEKTFLREKDRVLGQDYTNVSYRDALEEVIDLLLNNRQAIGNIYFSKGKEIIERYLKELGDEFCGGYIRARAAGRKIDDQILYLVTACYSEAFRGIMERWLAEYDGMKKDGFVEALSRLTESTVDIALNEMEKLGQEMGIV